MFINILQLGNFFLFACNRDSKYCLTSGIVVSVTLVKQCLKMWLFSWILLKIIIHLLCAKSASLQNEEQNKTQFGSKEITRQQIFKGVNILGDSDVLTGSAIIIFSSSVLPRSSLERRQMGKKTSKLVGAAKRNRALACETQAVCICK